MLTRFIDPVKQIERNTLIIKELERFVDEIVDYYHVSDRDNLSQPNIEEATSGGPSSSVKSSFQ
jgi:hypothetical protein